MNNAKKTNPSNVICYIMFVLLSFTALLVHKKIFVYDEVKSISTYKSRKQFSKSPKRYNLTTKKNVATKKIVAIDSSYIFSQGTTMSALENSDSLFFADCLSKYFISRKRSSKGKVFRNDIIIRYYKKKADGKKIYALRELGFYIHERTTQCQLAGVKSNVIHYGDFATRSDILLVAYTLIKNGVEIHEISKSKFHDAWKSQSIEIGTDTTIYNQSLITLSTLRKEWGEK